jgi:SAM-dependent methyltransferase
VSLSSWLAVKVANNACRGQNVSRRFRHAKRTLKDISSLNTDSKRIPLFSIIKWNFPAQQTVSFADLATGTGEFVDYFTSALRKNFSRVEGVGIEPFQRYANQALAKGRNVVLGMPECEGDYERAGLTNNSKDIVTINNIESHHWALIDQAVRIVKPNGLIIVSFEKYDILECRGIDERVESNLREKGFDTIRILMPLDFHIPSIFTCSYFIIIARQAT